MDKENTLPLEDRLSIAVCGMLSMLIRVGISGKNDWSVRQVTILVRKVVK